MIYPYIATLVAATSLLFAFVPFWVVLVSDVFCALLCFCLMYLTQQELDKEQKTLRQAATNLRDYYNQDWLLPKAK